MRKLLPGQVDTAIEAELAKLPENFQVLMAYAVDKRLREILAEAETAEVEPFFNTREVTHEMKRQQTVAEQNKFSYIFEDFGCLLCARADVPHYGMGMCGSCYHRTRSRMRLSVAKRAPKGEPVRFKDTVRLAREALLPSIEKLSKKREGQ